MTDFGDVAVDATGNLTLTDGDLLILGRSQAIQQDVRIALLMVLGEWFRDTQRGVPWFTEILTKPSTKAIADRNLRRAILSVRGVTSVTRVTITEGNDRIMRVVAIYRDRFSTTEQTAEVQTP
jgi:stringent starvation protein B